MSNISRPQYRIAALAGVHFCSDRHSARFQRRASRYATGPRVVSSTFLTNPALNYVQFLLRAILDMVLHVVIAFSPEGMRWVGNRPPQDGGLMEGGGGGGQAITTGALIGKLAPYWVLPFAHGGDRVQRSRSLGVSFRGDFQSFCRLSTIVCISGLICASVRCLSC